MFKQGLPKQDHWPDRRGVVALLPLVVTRAARPVYYGPTQKLVTYVTGERPGTIVVDPANHFLYSVQKGGQAVQYEVGVGKEGYGWSGTATVHDKQEWPDWYPTQDIFDRKPEIRQYMVPLRSGYGMLAAPIIRSAARALYLWQGKVDTLYRIHSTNEPESIGQDVSAGCIRMRNDDVIDLYERTPNGTKSSCSRDIRFKQQQQNRIVLPSPLRGGSTRKARRGDMNQNRF